jgi:ADP-ribose pyrophosphatase YjhB (NUDIX family)
MTREIRPIPAVNAIILNQSGLLLLTRRSASVREPGKWCLPGGHLEGGEDWISALGREVREEVGLHVRAQKLVGLYSDPNVTIAADLLSDGCRAQYVVASFLVIDYGGEVIPNHEVDDWGWFSFDQLPDPLLKSHPIRIADALNFCGEVFVR